ncbi:MAG: hypothetical protein BWK80_09120 [Desulfobacteraceae bacterium IS3]|nr:MAG: hypothetical protein BWK80_09120 [Desulfobacteraceae bacterium IS3]
MSYIIKITPEMKRQFHSEAAEHLNNFENMLMLLEKDHGHQDALRSAFRDIHSIKGNSDYLGIKDINILSHELEDLMDDLRSSRIPVSKDVLAVLFEGLDLLRDMNRRIMDNDYEETDISPIRERISQAKTLCFESPECNLGTPEGECPAAESFADGLEQEIKVDLEKIDTFMRRVSELTLARNILNYLTENGSSRKEENKWRGELRKVSADINRITNDLHSDVMKLRMVKIGTLFERLPRIVRDLSHQSGKKIELYMSGGETELERKTAEQIVDPLIHLIRNAVDHGIESPDDRKHKGKSAAGSITVKAHQEANYAVIDVADDGTGLDAKKIREAALRKKIVSESVLMSMTDKEIIDLVFMPGFSTLSETTKISGRGVGLDIVKNNILTMRGSISISGEPGVGAFVRLKIPVSMSVSDVLLTIAVQRQYAFPFSSVLKSIKIRRNKIRYLNHTEAIVSDGKIFPLRHLGDMLGIAEIKTLRQDSCEEIAVILLSFGNQVRGVAVDAVLRRESILIKPLEKCLGKIKEFSGSVLLGDGSIALVIDPAGLFQNKQ